MPGGSTRSLQPPAEAAADQMIVHDDFLRRQACGLRGQRLNPRDRLATDPDFARILAKVNRAVHRLHRRVGQKWNLIDRLDLAGGLRHGLVDVADVLRHRARSKGCPIEFACDLFCGESRVRTIVPFDLQRCQAFLRSSHMIGDYRNGVVEPHDLPHAFDGFCRRILDALHASAEHRRLRQSRDLHARRASIDAVDRGPINLGGRIKPVWPACR
jgi:hypothetical protein